MPTPEDIEQRVNALTEHATSIGLNPSLLELKNSEQQIKPPSRLKDIVSNANVKATNLEEQAAIALHELDSNAALSTAAQTQAQAQFLRHAIDLLSDENPGVDAAKLATAQRSIEVFKAMNDRSIADAQSVDAARLEMYAGAIKDATKETLTAQGFSDAEVDVFAVATTKQLMAGQADLKTSLEMATPIAAAMNQNLQSCTTRISEIDPSATKVHDAMAQAFNTSIKVAPDGDRSLKPMLEGSETGTFSLRKANAFVQETAEERGVALQPVVAPHQRLEPTSIPHVGGSLTTEKGDNAMAAQQASVTFKVTSDQAMDDSGASVAFAKRGFGARTAELQRVIGSTETDIMKSQFKDQELAGTVAPLFGTAASVSQATDLKGTVEAIGGDLQSLPSRSVATTAVDKALGMNCVATEKVGIDEDRRAVGVSVAVAGAPILKRPTNPTESEAFLNIDYSDPEIQKGLSDLEVQDYITGQIDRHAGNIFIDPTTKTVRGIDNDLAFPTIDREVMLQDGLLAAKAVRGMPQFMHEDTASKIEALSPAELRTSLENLPIPPGTPGLEPAAIDGAVKRLEKLQAEIKNMRIQGRVVAEFNNQTFLEAQAEQVRQTKPDLGLGDVGNAGVPRTSYVGTAVMTQARTLALNQSAKSVDHRTMVNAKDVPGLEINEQFAAYKNAVDQAKQAIIQDPHTIDDMRQGAQVQQAKNRVDALETELAAKTQDMQAMASRVSAPRIGPQSERQTQLNTQAKTAFHTAQEDRQKTLQELAKARRNLDSVADKVIEDQKPGIYRTVGMEYLSQQANKAQLEVQHCQEQVTATQGAGLLGGHRRDAAETNLKAAQEKADQAQQKLTQFDAATLDAVTQQRTTVAESMGRPRANSIAAIEQSNALPAQSNESQNQGWNRVDSSENVERKSTRAALGGHRKDANGSPSQTKQEPKVRRNTLS